MNHLRWSRAEKTVAKKAFEKAYRKECEATIEELKEKVASAKEPADLWQVQDFLGKKLTEIEEKYDYRYSVLIFVFARLVNEGRLQEPDLKELREDKLEKIKYLANPEDFSYKISHRRTNMKYEVTIKLLIETRVDEDRLMGQIESLFDCGTVLESFADALKLDETPHLLSVAVPAPSTRATTGG